MKVLAGPDNWSYFTANFCLGLEGHDARVFRKGEDLAEGEPFSGLLSRLPAGWEPDWVVWWLPEYQRLPPDMEECPYPTLLVISDWNVLTEPLERVVGLVDVVATDALGYQRLREVADVPVIQAQLYGYLPEVHRRLPGVARDLPVGYVGNTNGLAYRERMRTLATACRGLEKGRVTVASGVYGEDYVRLLNRFQITLNHSLRGELNMRSYEAMACGSLLFCEETNLEVKGLFRDGEDLVLYNRENLVDKLRYYLDRPAELREVAERGHQRVREFSYQNGWSRLLERANEALRDRPRPWGRLERQERTRRWCDYSYQLFNPLSVPASREFAETAVEEYPDDPILRNALGCLQAMQADLSVFGEREQWLEKAERTLARVRGLGLLPELSRAQVLIEQGRHQEAWRLLKDPDPAFREVAYYPRLLHPLTFLWERETEPLWRERSVRWRYHDLLSTLVPPQECAEQCRRALSHRDDQAVTWFRLSRVSEGDEQLEALGRTVELAPFFLEAHLLRIEAGAGRPEMEAWVEEARKLIAALAGPEHEADREEWSARLDALLQGVEETKAEQGLDAVEFAQRVRFDFCSPRTNLNSLFLWEPRRWLERNNTVFPEADEELKRRLDELWEVPRMSTLAVGGIINWAVQRMPEGQAYLNVGVWNGFSFLAGLVGNPEKLCIGVDNFSQFGGPAAAFEERFLRLKGPAHQFHDLDYEEYLKTVHKAPLGVYFYDGEHSYANQYLGLLAAERFFAPGCIVLVDDTNWDDPRGATLDFIAQSENRYRIVLDARTPFSGHSTWWNGLMVLEFLGKPEPKA